mmetsp:Transcript_22859/g.47702  ORF Transcript_22859/g.47702 Transcript_22859/m.47702 type:complete len:819 (-) Transcript_22859:189-2645(-)
MADDESRAARQKALAEKKRRLEEIKARRRGGGAAPAATATASTSTPAAASNNNLDSYIDDLLKTTTPGLTLAPSAAASADAPPAASGGDAKAATDEEKGSADEGSKADTAASSPPATDSPAATTSTTAAAATDAPPKPKVETFEIAIQCEEDDFPPPSLVDEDEAEDEKSSQSSDDDDEKMETSTANDNQNIDSHADKHSRPRSSSLKATFVEPLSEEQKSKMLASPPFTQFLSTASKRVERLLGAGEESMYGILNGSGWGGSSAGGEDGAGSGGGAVDFSVDYANEEEEWDSDEEEADGVTSTVGGSRKKRRSKKKTKEEAYQSGGFFTARATYEFPKFTRGRNVTDIEWCPGHKEWVLASYNAVSAGGARGGAGGEGDAGGTGMPSHNPSTRHLSPHDPSSSFLQTIPSSAIPNEGIVAIYNLSMPSRPEHVFCAGCPILNSQFHPTEHPKLILGGASSGQVLVWDARVGRYPVQRSGALGGGHDCELVGMKVLGADTSGVAGGGAAGGAGGSLTTSKLVTASSDGKVNYWSVSNLREPMEHVQVNANLSCLETLRGSSNTEEGVVCGDERGGIHTIVAGTGRDGSSSSKRVVKTLHPGGVMGGSDPASAPALMEEDADAEELSEMGHYGMVTAVATRPTVPQLNSPRAGNKETTSSAMGMSKGFLRGAGGLMVTTGVDWSTKLWAPAYSNGGPLMSFLSNSYDYMCDVQWSPIHPSIFATASSNGTLNIWNLATSLDQPISGTDGIPIDGGSADDSATSRQGLNRLQWSADGRRMAVASGDKLHVLGVGEDVWKSKGDEEGRVMHNLVSRGLIQE